MTPVRLEPAALRSRVKHSTTEPLRSLCILMDFLIHINTISMGLPILYFNGHRKKLNHYVLLSLKVALILANNEDPNEMQHYAAFHLVLQCLPEYPFRGFQYTEG